MSEGGTMPKYLFLGSYTADAWKVMVENPPNRETAASELASALISPDEAPAMFAKAQSAVASYRRPGD
jgi:hypothetical protein